MRILFSLHAHMIIKIIKMAVLIVANNIYIIRDFIRGTRACAFCGEPAREDPRSCGITPLTSNNVCRGTSLFKGLFVGHPS